MDCMQSAFAAGAAELGLQDTVNLESILEQRRVRYSERRLQKYDEAQQGSRKKTRN